MESTEQNVGAFDRLVRTGIAIIILLVLVRSGKVSFMTAVSLFVGGMLLSSATSGVCPLYTQFGICSMKKS